MFGVIRCIIGFVFLGCSVLLIKKHKITYSRLLYIILTGVTVVLVTILQFIPFESAFVTFESAEAAYKYLKFGKSNIELIVEGTNCDLVVDRKDESYLYQIIPKNEEGYKVGVGTDTRLRNSYFQDGISVDIIQYKNRSDYFITIVDINGGESIISDDYNTKFYPLKRDNDLLGKPIVTYYAHVPHFDSQYNVNVNGNTIPLSGKLGR